MTDGEIVIHREGNFCLMHQISLKKIRPVLEKQSSSTPKHEASVKSG